MTVEKRSLPFGDGMGIAVAFSNAISIRLSDIKRQVWVSGQIALNEENQLVGKGDIGLQTDQCLRNLQLALNGLDANMVDVVQVTVFVKNMEGLKTIHEVRRKYFNEPFPASTLIQVTGFVHPDALIEINAMAVV